MKAVIVNCSETYEYRVDLIYDFLKSKGCQVTIIQSNFMHFKKEYRKESKEDYIFVKTRPYYRNLSFARIFSHYKFAKDAFSTVEKIEPDILFTLVPPNSLAKFASLYKKKHKKVKLVFDIIDLWPESMPINISKKLLPFKLWLRLRDNGLNYADFVVTECNLYKSVLKDVLCEDKTETVYLTKRKIEVVSNPLLSDNEIHLAYLGSINNIIDIIKI